MCCNRQAALKFAIVLLLLAAAPALLPRQAAVVEAQCSSYTQVTGTITDPDGIPYAYGKITATITPSGGGSPTCTGSDGLQHPFANPVGPAQLDAAGSFTMQLPPNSIISNGGGTWAFSVSITGNPPPIGTGPQKFSASIAISGGSQDVSATLSAAAPGLCKSCGTGGGGAVQNAAQYTLFMQPNPGTANVAGPSQITTDPTGNVNLPASAKIKGPIPWLDVRSYGVRTGLATGSVTTATVTGGNASVPLASASDFIVGDGLVISNAGAAPSLSTPAAPTVTVNGPTGTATISYECVASDFYEGLTAASAAGTVTNAPTPFGDSPHGVSSISGNGTTATVTLSSSLPVSSGNYHVILQGASNTGFDGLQYATVIGATTFTFPSTVNASASGGTARLVNGFIITAISRSTAGVITATTDTAVNFSNALVQIYGVSPNDLDGWYWASGSGTTVTIDTALNATGGTETGSLLSGNGQNYGWNTMGMVVWEFTSVACPSNTSVTRYYVYANYGSGYELIGSTVPWESGGNAYTEDHYTFEDWGPWLGAGYVPPPAANVPSTPPAAAQNDEYVGTITAINGNTVTASPAPVSTVSGVNAFHDNSLAIQAADTAAAADASAVYFPPGTYVWNAPFPATSTGNNPLTWAYGGVDFIGNDTAFQTTQSWTLESQPVKAGYGNILQFGTHPYSVLGGVGNPIVINERAGGVSPLLVSGLQFSASSAGQTGIYELNAYGDIENDAFSGNTFATSVPLVFGASGFTQHARNISLTGGVPANLVYGAGQPQSGPPIGLLGVRGSAASGANMPQLIMDGTNTMTARGVEFDSTYGVPTQPTPAWLIENVQTYQAPWTPPAFAYGSFTLLDGGTLSNVTCDSNVVPEFAAIGAAVRGLSFSHINACGNYTGPFSAEFSGGMGQNTDAVSYASPGCGQACFSAALGEMGTDYELRGLDFGSGLPDAMFFDAPITGVSVTATGTGTWAAGSHAVSVAGAGWNGGFGPTTTVHVTTNGSQAIQINCTLPQGYKGIYIAVDGRGQQTGPQQCGVTLTADNFSIGYDYNPSDGPTSVSAASATVPDLRLTCSATNCPYKVDFTAPSAMTANRTITAADGNTQTALVASLTTTAATSDTVAIQGMTSSGHCSLTPTNAAADSLLTATYISAKTANQITVTHTATAGATFDILCTAN